MYLLKAYQAKFGYDERVMSFEKATGQFFEMTEYLEYYYENIAKTGNFSKLNALKTINKAGNIYTIANMLNNFADGNYESAFETVIGFIPYASQFMSFIEFTDSEAFLTSMKDAADNEIKRLAVYQGNYAQKCMNDYSKIYEYCKKRLNNKAYFEEIEYHNEHCTCFKNK